MTTLTVRTHDDVHPVLALNRPQPPTVALLLSRYRQEYFPTLAPETQAVRRRIFGWMARDLADIPLEHLTPFVLRQYCHHLEQRVDAATVRTYLRALSAALTVAVEVYEWLPRNPLEKVPLPRLPPLRVRFLSLEEQERLLLACQASRCPALLPAALLALTTGARRAEVLMRPWEDVDLSKRVLRLQHTKNHVRHAVPMPPMTVVALEDWRTRQVPTSRWLFPGRYRGEPPVCLHRYWWEALALANVQNFRWHDFRHTAASYLLWAGCPLIYVKEILGHRSLATTERYAHLADSHLGEWSDRMAERFIHPLP